MNNIYRFLRCAALMVLTMTWIMPAMAQHPFTLTTQAQHDAHSGEALYWIESYGATGFYMIPKDITNNAGVSTSNMPNERMLWYFMDAGIEDNTQYYYIVNKSAGRYLCHTGNLGDPDNIKIVVKDDANDASCKFSVSGSSGQWLFSPKSGSTYYVNKKGSNVNYTNGLKSSTANDANSKWNFVAKNDVTWAHPFTNSTASDKHYYLIQNRHSSYTSFYMSTDASSYVTVSNEANNYRIWYFVEASTDAEIPNMKYYYIVNAVTGKYMYFNGNTTGNSLNNVFNIQTHSGGDDDRYQFAIVNAVGTGYSAYAIMPKKLIRLYQNKYTSLGTSTMNNGQHIGTLKDRDSNENTAHWLLVESMLFDPEISCDGEYITITCATEEASIYYRLNQTGDFSLYSSPIVFNATTTVEAYSYKDDNTSIIVTNTFEKYDNPFDESTRSLDSWTYDDTQVTLPYSVNCIDGHSSSYSKGTFTFETSINIYKIQPTYLWFQHADQSADIYVDNAFVTTHWGGYNAFFVDISDYVHLGTNRITVVLNNTTRNVLAPAAGDFNFNATLGKVKLFTSPVVPSMDYGYDGFHITSSVSDVSATIYIKTSIPVGASVICTIDAEDGSYHFTDTKPSTGSEMTFTTTISNPHLWNGTEDPFLYNVTLEIYHNNELYHRYERPYGFRYYEYVINEPVAGVNYTGFLLNGSPYLLRGVCMHDDLEGKANALNDDDYAQEFAIIQDLGCNFIRLAHYPHPKEVYDWCDRLGIIVQTEVPCVNKLQSTMPQDYYNHLSIQYKDMVRQHFNHPCIVFWGLSNETTTDDKEFAKTKIEEYTSFIKGIDSERLVGYVMSHGVNDPSGYYNNPDVDWFGCNIYTGWYYDTNSNNPTSNLNTRLTNTLTNKSKPLAFSEYGCGGTPSCHSDDFMTTTTRGNNPRHDIEYQMWLHEGHIAAIKNKPELLFTSQWQLFDIAVSGRNEGYTVCLDGENTSIDDNLRRLNNKGLVERDHKTKKDTYYLYKAWWNQTDKFVHICGKDYEKLTSRVIKCYTNDGNSLTLFVNNVEIETVTVVDNIATFTARNFNPGDVIRVSGATTYETYTFPNIFTTDGNWNVTSNWKGNVVPTDGSHAIIRAECTIPDGVVAQANNITIDENGALTIADGGQLVSNSAVNATVEKDITAYTIIQNQGAILSDSWYFIASPITEDYTPTGSMLENTYDLYRLNHTTWENFKNTAAHPDFTTLENGTGYLYANSNDVTLQFTGTLKPYAVSESVSVSTGWNLIGNPFTYNVYANHSFYKMNDDQTGIEAVSAYSTNPIAPCTGILVETATDDDVIFSKEAPAQSHGNGSLQIALHQANARGNALLDNAIVSFNDDSQLGKFYFGTQNANIYIPYGADEYAIVSVGRDGVHTVSTIDVNFKAKKNGIYTIAVNPADTEMSYLHLIDNITGADVNLLQTPEYTFDAMTTDHESRFKLLFVRGDANDDNETFAYLSNGDIIITGEGELQIFDVMGRLVTKRYINGVETQNFVSLPTGVYIFKLNEKTQKIVIK